VAQGSVVPGPADIMYAPLAVANRPRALRLALLAAAGSTIGGLIAYGIGTQLGSGADTGQIAALLAKVGITPATLAPWHERLDRWGWALVLLATVSPLSTKLVCIAAGAVGVAPVPFMAALASGRTARTTTVAWLAGRIGQVMVESESRRARGDVRE
jgi:membrane protein YqaA with SNARE-associated domain